jgi:hypothetical protein
MKALLWMSYELSNISIYLLLLTKINLFFWQKMSEMEYEDMLNEARKTPAYSLEQAKKYLNL